VAWPLQTIAAMDRDDTIKSARRSLHSYARWLGRGSPLMTPKEAESVADDALWQAWRRFDPSRGGFVVFARRYVHGALKRTLAREGRAARVAADPAWGVEALTRSAPDPEVTLCAKRALQRVEPEARELVVRHLVEEEPLSYLAAEAGRSKASVWRQIERARRRMRGEDP